MTADNGTKITDLLESVALRSFSTECRSILSCSVVIVVWTLYLLGSIYGCTTFTVVSGADSALPPSSHASRYSKELARYWTDGFYMRVIVSKCPNLSLAHERASLEHMFHSFENTTYTMNASGTSLWYRTYLPYLTPSSGEMDLPKTWSEDLRAWSQYAVVKGRFDADLEWRNASAKESAVCSCSHILKGFVFRVGMRNYDAANGVTIATHMREIADRYEKFGVFTYFFGWHDADVMAMLPRSTLRGIGMAVAATVILTALLIPKLLAVVSVTLCLLSVVVGVLGCLSLLKFELDISTMVAVFMSIGLSIDYLAHIAHQFTHVNERGIERLCITMRKIGQPVMMAAASTFLGVLALATTSVLFGRVLFTTIALVIALSILHACFLFPLLLVGLEKFAACAAHAALR